MPLFSWSRLGVAAPFDPKDAFVSSPLLSPASLVATRTLIAPYTLCTICTVLGFDVATGPGPTFLCYFTELSYIGLTAYYITTAQSSSGRCSRRRARLVRGLAVRLGLSFSFLPSPPSACIPRAFASLVLYWRVALHYSA
ncbi:hypothetical protein C8R44DRAFT_886160 [Mycena epipterygia]|nr:hypothetical protein C8R44DRAFT_886160 [Mycena epipterygia]